MLRLALVFLVIALIAGLTAMSGIWVAVDLGRAAPVRNGVGRGGREAWGGAA